MQRTTKTFIGGIILGAIITNIIMCNLYINNDPQIEPIQAQIELLREIKDTLTTQTCYQINDTDDQAQDCIAND